MNKVFFSIGSNLGNSAKKLARAIEYIKQEMGLILATSKVYETKAWGVENQPNFLNQVILIETKISPHEVLSSLLTIEETMGRIRTQKWFSRIIDIDILFYNNEIINTENLIIPHPRISKRNFVLIPFLDIAPNFIHPVSKKMIKQLALDCEDKLSVKVFKEKT